MAASLSHATNCSMSAAVIPENGSSAAAKSAGVRVFEYLPQGTRYTVRREPASDIRKK